MKYLLYENDNLTPYLSQYLESKGLVKNIDYFITKNSRPELLEPEIKSALGNEHFNALGSNLGLYNSSFKEFNSGFNAYVYENGEIFEHLFSNFKPETAHFPNYMYKELAKILDTYNITGSTLEVHKVIQNFTKFQCNAVLERLNSANRIQSNKTTKKEEDDFWKLIVNTESYSSGLNFLKLDKPIEQLNGELVEVLKDINESNTFIYYESQGKYVVYNSKLNAINNTLSFNEYKTFDSYEDFLKFKEEKFVEYKIDSIMPLVKSNNKAWLKDIVNNVYNEFKILYRNSYSDTFLDLIKDELKNAIITKVSESSYNKYMIENILHFDCIDKELEKITENIKKVIKESKKEKVVIDDAEKSKQKIIEDIIERYETRTDKNSSIIDVADEYFREAIGYNQHIDTYFWNNTDVTKWIEVENEKYNIHFDDMLEIYYKGNLKVSISNDNRFKELLDECQYKANAREIAKNQLINDIVEKYQKLEKKPSSLEEFLLKYLRDKVEFDIGPLSEDVLSFEDKSIIAYMGLFNGQDAETFFRAETHFGENDYALTYLLQELKEKIDEISPNLAVSIFGRFKSKVSKQIEQKEQIKKIVGRDPYIDYVKKEQLEGPLFAGIEPLDKLFEDKSDIDRIANEVAQAWISCPNATVGDEVLKEALKKALSDDVGKLDDVSSRSEFWDKVSSIKDSYEKSITVDELLKY